MLIQIWENIYTQVGFRHNMLQKFNHIPHTTTLKFVFFIWQLYNKHLPRPIHTDPIYFCL